LRAIDPDPILEMNPKAAAHKGIEEGDWVRIHNNLGEASFKVRLTPIIHEDTVNAEHGWWFPEEEGAEPNLFGVWKSAVNMMCPSGDNSVMGFGAPLKCLMCDVEKLR
jgi:anaerobic selenocysteine-containing dehydrogenase